MNVDRSQYEKYAPKPVENENPEVQEIKETVLVDQVSVSIVQ